MSLSIFNATTIPALEEVLHFAEKRHAVLASNIANLDTPGYRSRDLDPALFESSLKEAIESNELSGTDGGLAPEVDFSNVREATSQILFHDGSDVGMEHQVTEMAKNQGRFNMALTIMTNQMRLLQAAISERV